MKSVITAAVLAAAFLQAGPAAAQERTTYPWCATENDGATDCGFTSFQQCEAYIRGIGGSCSANPAYEARRSGVSPTSDEQRDPARGPLLGVQD